MGDSEKTCLNSAQEDPNFDTWLSYCRALVQIEQVYFNIFFQN